MVLQPEDSPPIVNRAWAYELDESQPMETFKTKDNRLFTLAGGVVLSATFSPPRIFDEGKALEHISCGFAKHMTKKTKRRIDESQWPRRMRGSTGICCFGETARAHDVSNNRIGW